MIRVDDSLHGYRTCHMTGDTTDELHEFADRLGIPRSRFRPGAHGRTAFDRYPITVTERERAIAAGAAEETWRDAALRMLERQAALA